ncbi:MULTISPECIES: hypothetical protein [Rhodococcus]|uniref:hypothetical protein n=1 Tax=Rhodococcus TaxID=1827 RepID=UPI00038DBFED|nr:MULTISPECIES: hypothetical protein [Rhodococcus]AGT91865.1 serine/threonine protein kinase [Rhodococcus erythropolis CCM2595]MCJ0895647.1 serine/threonine protein kinase [Rhodococcus sp. ARC_M13]MCZ4639412.1 serine/threonine protein kinase [Rhodococcus erythropolis]SUE07998.1 serine/threonine protein kinase [Rhodococcus erythropolis]
MTTPQPPYPWNNDPNHTTPLPPPPPPPPGITPGQAPYSGHQPAYTPPRPPYGQGTGYSPMPPRPPKSYAWLWVLLGVVTVALVAVVVYVWVLPLVLNDNSDENSARTETVVITSPAAAPQNGVVTPAPNESVPASAARCGSVFSNNEFTTSAVGTSVTSCEFAEEVRYQYVSQGRRGGPVSISAVSPVTGTRYSMNCAGNKVVTCTGGNNAVVYVY